MVNYLGYDALLQKKEEMEAAAWGHDAEIEKSTSYDTNCCPACYSVPAVL